MSDVLGALAKDSIVYGVGMVVSRFGSVLVLPIYARYFLPAEYGLLDLLTTTSLLLGLLLECQIVSAVAREYFESKSQNESRELVGTALLLYAFTAVGCLLVGAAALFVWGKHFRAAVPWSYFWAIVLGVAPTQIAGLMQVLLRYRRQRKTFVVLSICDAFAGLLIGLALSVWCGFGIGGVLWGLLIGKVLTATALALSCRELVNCTFKTRRAKALLKYGVPLLPAVLTKWGQNHANRYVIAGLLTLNDVGTFGVAVRISATVSLLDAAFRQAWDPYAMKAIVTKCSEPVIAAVLGLYLYVMCLVCTAVGLFGSSITVLVAGHRYVSAGRLVCFLAFGLLWNGVAGIVAIGNAWTRRTYLNSVGFALGLITHLALIYELRAWSLLGVAFSYVIGALVAAWVVLLTAEHNHRVNYSKMDLVLTSLITLASSCIITFYDDRLASWNEPQTSLGPSVIRLTTLAIVWFAIRSRLTHYWRKCRSSVVKLDLVTGAGTMA